MPCALTKLFDLQLPSPRQPVFLNTLTIINPLGHRQHFRSSTTLLAINNMRAAELDTYWRLPTHDTASINRLRERLKTAGYKAISKFHKPKLIELTRRIERGLICYDSCKKAELVSFAKARNVEIEKNEARMSLIEKLEEADRNATFEKLFDLPAELRNHIYEAYLAEFAEQLDCPSQPPLARISKQARSEVLPLFYGQTTFLICLNARLHLNEAEVPRIVLDLPMRAHAFIHSLQYKYAAKLMKHIEYRVDVDEDTQENVGSFHLVKKKNKCWVLSVVCIDDTLEKKLFEHDPSFKLSPSHIYTNRLSLEKTMK